MTKIKKEIERVKLLEKQGLDNTYIEEFSKKTWQDRGKENEQDRKIFQIFKDLTIAWGPDNNDRFSMDYVRELPVFWNILIVLGKKNIGKTYNIHKLIDECIQEDREVFMLRVTAKEIISALHPFLMEPRSKVQLQGRGNNVFDIVLKERQPGEKKAKKIGYCASVNSLTHFQGASYPKVKYIIWDECISDGSNQKLTLAQIRGFERFVSSVVRDKTDVKVIIFGNLLEKVDGHRGDPLLSFYGINPSCNCKYIKAKTISEASILFINTGSLFRGIEEQGIIGGVDSGITDNLLSNKISEDGIKTVDPPVYWEGLPIHTLLFSYNTKVYGIHLRESDIPEEPNFLLIWIKPFHVNDVSATADNKKVYTNEEALGNKYSHCVAYVDADQWSDMVHHLLDYLAVNRVFYVGTETAEMIEKLAKHLKVENPSKDPFGTILV